ncbi:MAG: 50S ribosomal protein L11 methyltransferase [Deltaproteobacteria bacterium]|nr:50S ribosomal protein L11 methyltransferase [Deltaproteobacteria bacterium]
MSSAQRHVFVTVRLLPEQLELAELRLWELGATGIEERDQTTIVREPSHGDVVVYASFEHEAAAVDALSEIRSEYEADLLYLPHQNWATEWRRGFGAQRIGRRLLLHPSWEPVKSEPGDVVLTIDPENAFGSGDHETTRLVLGLLDRHVQGNERVLDVGCGSGILSIAAIRLGAASSVAVDIEEDAVLVTERNATINGVASRIEVSTTSLDAVDGVYDLVLANIETRVLVHMPGALRARMAPGAALILSGILREERDELLVAYDSMCVDELVEEGEWCALVLREEAP